MSQMEEAKAEVEKKVSILLKFIQTQNKNKISKITKRELVIIVNDLYKQCQLLYSGSLSRSSSDLDYYSSEEIEANAGNVSESFSSNYTLTMLRKIQENEELNYLRDQNMEYEGKRNEDKEPFKGSMMTNDEVALLRNHQKELELKLKNKTIEALETQAQLKHLEEETEERVKEQENIINRLSMEIKDQKKLIEEQKDVIDKFSEDEKLMKRCLKKKMEELSEDFKMKMEDHMRILHRRIHVAEQIHLDSKSDYIKTRETQENKEQDVSVSETQFKKIKEMVDKGLAGPEMAIKKLEEGKELTTRVTKLAKEIDSAKKWVREKKDKTKHEVETLEAKLECREAQEGLLKEKLSKLEAKLGEEGTGKMSVEKAMRRIKKLEMKVKERDVDLLCLGEEKREAIRQLCVLVDYQRSRYDDLKANIFKVALHA